MGPHGEIAEGWSFYNKNTAPRQFDIVLCKFPLRNKPHLPPHRCSPCLVRQVRIHKTDDKAFVTAVFGTSNTKILTRANVDLIISQNAAMERHGLWQATRFDLAAVNSVELPWAAEWFPIPNGRMSPIIGSLDNEAMQQLVDKLTYRKKMNFWG